MRPEAFYRKYVFNSSFNSFNENIFHLSGYIAASGYLGIKISIKSDKRFFYKNDVVIGCYDEMHTSLVSNSAVRLCKNKKKTINALNIKSVAVPLSHQFCSVFGYKKALKFAKASGSLVMKPANARAGQGISTQFSWQDDSFKAAWLKAKAATTNRRILLEEKLEGLDVRAIVVGGQFVCAVTRLPAYVVGDGSSTVAELVEQKNAFRKQNKAHARHPLKLEYYSIDPSLVPAADHFLQLTEISNVHLGGEAVDVTNLLPSALRELAEAAADAIPGLGVVGVDMIATDFEGGVAKVIELNTACNFMIHQAPLYGQPRYPAEQVLKCMLRQAGLANE
ncbi:D-alanine-D-alanine ligase [Marinospirillum celere]|uniref:D-alanine-D-alanine ligase n=1 Tax=Marinospirillum celere TaxID=1122252 RepID=A0A1I1E9F5_9GAMM|nr:ATP-grasp domain-containing protein [Marinospirillum celere]SFB83734.1 D-alanine-D-alanine ligase [Marinospirillum celere]